MLSIFLAGCSVSRTPPATSVRPAILEEPVVPDSAAPVFDEVLTVRSTQRVAELKNLGGPCAAYGSVLESSLQEGRVKLRPYMWRVGGQLVSGEARHDGAIVVARHIDPLNVGVRTVDDVIWSLEHEAAHLTFRIPNGGGAPDDGANAVVRSCRG